MKTTNFRTWIGLLTSGTLFAATGATCQQKDVAEILGTTEISQNDVTATGTNVSANSATGVAPGTFIGPRP